MKTGSRHIRTLVLAAVTALMTASPSQATTLRVAIPALPASLGVPFTAAGQPSSVTWVALFDGLTRLDPQGAVNPALAMSWVAVSPRVWRFTLRPNVLFHDGAPVTAAAIAASLEILRAPSGRKFYVASEVQNIAGLRAIDALTLEIETQTPDAILPRRMSLIPIVAAHVWAAKGEAGFAQTPVGTGPYRVTDWGKSSGSAKFTAAESWRKPREMDGLELIPLEDPVARVQALLSGRVDIAARLNGEDIASTKAAGFTVASLPAPQVMSLTFRLAGNAKSPIADVRVRRALGMAINRTAMAQQIMQGLVQPASQAASRETAGFNPDLPLTPVDLDRAKALLAEAGYPKGFTLTAEVLVGASPADDLIYQQTAQDLSRIGVTLTLRSIPYAVWLRKYTAGDWGDVDAFSLMWDANSLYDAIRPLSIGSCRKAVPFFCDQKLMPLFDAVDAEMDEGKRLVALRALEARVVDEVPALWMVTTTHNYALSPALKDVALRNSGVIYENLTTRR